MAFRGWPAEALEFFDALAADNTKSFWQGHKHEYEDLVRAPMERLVAELAPDFGDGRVVRPYRDVRFSRDKSPYKTYIAALVGDGYVQLTADRLGAGAGMWEMASDQLERYRRAVDAARSGSALVGIVADVRAQGVEVVGHDVLKTAPRGYPKDHPRIELLRFKGLVAWREWPAGAWLGTARSKERVAQVLRAAGPLTAWLNDHVGGSTLEGRP